MMRFISHLLPYHDFYSDGFFSTRWLHTRTEAQYYSPRNPTDTPWCIFEPPVFPSLGKILDHPSYQDLAFDTPINTKWPMDAIKSDQERVGHWVHTIQ